MKCNKQCIIEVITPDLRVNRNAQGAITGRRDTGSCNSLRNTAVVL